MFTTGAKAFLGALGATVVGLVTMAFLRAESYPAIASMGLVGLALAFLLIGSLASYYRDNTVSAMDDAAVRTSQATAQPASGSLWPLAGAAGGVLLAIGTVTDARYFIAGLVLVLVALVQWMLQAWADRASGDSAANAEVRNRLAGSWEVPVGGAIAAAGIVWAMSRILLANSATVSLVVLSVVALAVLLIGTAYALGKLPKKALLGAATVGGLAVFGGGLASALVGENHHLEVEAEEAHEIKELRATNPAEICDQEAHEEGEEAGHASPVAVFDKNASEAVSSTAGTFAFFTLTEGGLELRQYKDTLEGSDTLTIPRGNAVNVLFRNETDHKHRLTITGGAKSVVENGETQKFPLMFCTQAIEEGHEQLLTVVLPRASIYEEGGAFKAYVPGVDGAEIKVVVP